MKNEKPRMVRLTVGVTPNTILHIKDLSFPGEDTPVKIFNIFENGLDTDFSHPTLRDVSILLNAMVGQGVIWNLAEELSSKLNTSHEQTLRALLDILDEYSKLSEEEAEARWSNVKDTVGSESVWVADGEIVR